MGAPQTPPHSEGSSVGLIIGIVIILAIVILGGLYFWGQKDQVMNEDTNTPAENVESADNETNSIEADLDSTDIENLDAEINAS